MPDASASHDPREKKMTRNSESTSTLAAMLLLLLAGAAAAQNAPPASPSTYPAKPIRVVLPFAPGGSSDAMVRIIGPRIGDAMGQSLVIDNRPGAAGNIAAEIVAKSPADGYTIFMGSSMLTTNKNLFTKIPFDPVNDFASITHLATAQYVLVVHPSLPVTTIAQFIALAKAKPGALSYGSAGVGVGSHLAGELLKLRAGIDLLHIPYKGGGPASIAILTGDTQVFFGTVVSGLTFVKAGRLRALAVSGATRAPLAPELPTLSEAGLPGFDVTTWDCFVAPAGTPPAIIARIHAETAKAMRMPDIRERVVSIGYEPTATGPEALTEFLRKETAMWAEVIRKANIRAD